MIVNKIYGYIAEKEKTVNEAIAEEVAKLAGHIFKRQFMLPEGACKLRMSSVGKCVRQLCYTYHGEPKNGKEIDSRAKLIFWAGDLTELTIVGLAKAAGCTVAGTGLNQITLSMKIGNLVINGHPDGLVIHDRELYLLEVKSMSSFSYARFEKGEIDDSYIMQVNMYMHELGVKKCIFVAQNKDNGLLGEMVINYDEAIYQVGVDKLHSIVGSNEKDPLPRPHKPDAKGFYSWKCAYCSYFNTCLVEPGLAERVVVRNSYKLKAKEATNAVPKV